MAEQSRQVRHGGVARQHLERVLMLVVQLQDAEPGERRQAEPFGQVAPERLYFLHFQRLGLRGGRLCLQCGLVPDEQGRVHAPRDHLVAIGCEADGEDVPLVPLELA